MTRAVAALALVCVVCAPAAALACAGCSNPNLQGARALDAGAGRGHLDLGAGLVATTMRVVHPEACPEIGPICAIRDEPPQLHDQRFYSAELRLFGALGLTESLGVEVQVPLRLLSTDITFRRLDGQAFTLPKHGLARRSMFEVVDAGEAHALFRLADSEESRKAYPFAFVLDMAFRLEGKSLRMEARVSNPGEETMPFSLMPLSPSSSSVTRPAMVRVTCCPLNSTALRKRFGNISA